MDAMKPLDEAMKRAADAHARKAVLRSGGVECLEAAIASLAADGWELKPRTPTNEMHLAGDRAYRSPAAIWLAMFDAAPKGREG